MSHNVYRHGRVHVCARMCTTCVFRPGNLMDLRPGRLRGMIDAATADDAGCIPCHCTLAGDNAVCRGFFDRYPTLPLRLALATGLVVYVEPPTLQQPN